MKKRVANPKRRLHKRVRKALKKYVKRQTKNPRQTFIIRATNKITGNDTKFRLFASSRRELQQILDRKYSNLRNFSITTEEEEEKNPVGLPTQYTPAKVRVNPKGGLDIKFARPPKGATRNPRGFSVKSAGKRK